MFAGADDAKNFPVTTRVLAHDSPVVFVAVSAGKANSGGVTYPNVKGRTARPTIRINEKPVPVRLGNFRNDEAHS